MQRFVSTCLALCLVALAVGCGPSMRIYPLVGEDKDLQHKFAPEPTTPSELPYVAALESAMDAAAGNDVSGLWPLLSTKTQSVLGNYASALNKEPQVMLQEGVYPSVSDPTTTTKRSLSELLFVKDFKLIEVLGDPADGTVTLTVVSKLNQHRPVTMIQEDGAWKIEKASFSDIL